MPHPLSRLRGPLSALGLLLLLWLLLPSAGRLFTREAFAEFQAPAIGLISRTRDLVRTAELTGADSTSLAAAGRDLARANAALELRVIQLESASAENRRLRAMLAAPAFPEFRTLVARVATRESGAWWSSLTLRRGRTDGVRPGCPVVFGDRVVGRVRAVHVDTCEVELITSPGFRCSAFLEGDEEVDGRRRTVFVEGSAAQPFTQPRSRVTFIPYTYSAPAGQPAKVVTTGLGGLYPAGLRLGTLLPGLEDTPEGAYRHGILVPAADLFSLREVGILIPTQPQPYEDLR
jgi:rod shape-determining protein MreC